MSVRIKKLFGKSKSLGKESRDAERTEGLWRTSPEDERASIRGSSMTLPSNPEDATSFPHLLPTSPREKKKKRFPTWRSKSRNKDKQFFSSSGEGDSVFNHRWVICHIISNALFSQISVMRIFQWGPYAGMHLSTFTGATLAQFFWVSFQLVRLGDQLYQLNKLNTSFAGLAGFQPAKSVCFFVLFFQWGISC